MKLAFSTLACPTWSVDRVIAAAREYGYDGIELRLIDGELIDRQAVREQFAGAGLPIVAIGTSVRVAAAPEAESALRELEPFLQIASDLESPVVRVFGGQWDGNRSQQQAIDQAKHVLAEAAAKAQPLGVSIALETHDRFSKSELVAHVLEDLPPAASALWDVVHPYRVGDDAEDVMRALAGRIAHVHIKDCRRIPSSDDWQLTLLGDGEVPVRSCMDALRNSGYAGWFSVEWEKRWHPDLAEPEVALPQFAELLRTWDRTA